MSLNPKTEVLGKNLLNIHTDGAIYRYSRINFIKSEAFDMNERQAYEGKNNYATRDLGATYTEKSTLFKLWSPTASRVTLCLYTEGSIKEYWMVIGSEGLWQKQVAGDLHGVYYTYKVTDDNGTVEIVDPYAKALDKEKKRGMVIDLTKTHPYEWNQDTFIRLEEKTDAIIYQLEIKNFFSHPNSGVLNINKYVAFNEKDTLNSEGKSTGLSYIKELGVTHIHLLDEVQVPHFCQSIEGSYCNHPEKGQMVINEFKQMIKSIHKQAVGIIIDLACSKLDLNTMVYWVKEFHIDGIRLKLDEAVTDDELEEIENELKKINPSIMLLLKDQEVSVIDGYLSRINTKGLYYCTMENNNAKTGTKWEEAIRYNKLAATLLFTSQGVPILKAGQEVLNTEARFNWENRNTNEELLEYYKGLIALRKEHSFFRLPNVEQANKYLLPMENMEDNVIGYTVRRYEGNPAVTIVFNFNSKDIKVVLPNNIWYEVVHKGKVKLDEYIEVKEAECIILAESATVLLTRY